MRELQLIKDVQAFYMEKHVQICEENNLDSIRNDNFSSEFAVKLYFSKEYLDKVNPNLANFGTMELDLNYGIYESSEYNF